jgi:hypothetical protein
MTFGMISIAETTTDIITLDTPIEELNDLTLNEVFRDGNLDYTALHSLSDLYYKTDGNVSNINNYYYALGKNLLSSDISFWEQGAINNSGVNTSSINAIRIIGFLPVFSNTTYTYTVSSSYRTISISEYDINFNYIIRTTNNSQTLTITTNIDTAYLRLVFGKNPTAPTTTSDLILGDILLEESLTPTTFESYIPPITLISLTDIQLTSLTQQQLDDYYDLYINGGYYEYDAILNDLDMTDFIIISSSFVLWLWFMRFVKGVL